jgi:hypothetical protein
MRSLLKLVAVAAALVATFLAAALVGSGTAPPAEPPSRNTPVHILRLTPVPPLPPAKRVFPPRQPRPAVIVG